MGISAVATSPRPVYILQKHLHLLYNATSYCTTLRRLSTQQLQGIAPGTELQVVLINAGLYILMGTAACYDLVQTMNCVASCPLVKLMNRLEEG